MAIAPPSERIWWREPIARIELIWITIGFCWGLIMFFMMIFWHSIGNQNLANEAYRITAEKYQEKVNAMVEQHTVREVSGIPVVSPPVGSDVYMLGRLWQWWPLLELKKGESYRLHLSSMDYQHGFSLQPVNLNVSVHPGYDMVMNITPTESGEFSIVCNEFCGIGHHLMIGKIFVVE